MSHACEVCGLAGKPLALVGMVRMVPPRERGEPICWVSAPVAGVSCEDVGCQGLVANKGPMLNQDEVEHEDWRWRQQRARRLGETFTDSEPDGATYAEPPPLPAFIHELRANIDSLFANTKSDPFWVDFMKRERRLRAAEGGDPVAFKEISDEWARGER